MAAEIRQELLERDVFHYPDRVFLAYGHDVAANKTVTDFFDSRRVTPLTIDPRQPMPELVTALLDLMKGAAAAVAMCTPDDKVKNLDRKSHYQPRPNVLLEIGLAVGIARSTRRLIVLQHEDAELPSNLGGGITLRYKSTVDEAFPHLEERLRRLVALATPRTP